MTKMNWSRARKYSGYQSKDEPRRDDWQSAQAASDCRRIDPRTGAVTIIRSETRVDCQLTEASGDCQLTAEILRAGRAERTIINGVASPWKAY